MSHITLPRAVVEQVRETLEKSAVRFFSLASYISPIESVNGVKPSRGREDVIAALAALDAALAEPEKKRAETGIPARSGVEGKIDTLTGEAYHTTEPPAKPEPATMEQIIAAHRATDGAPWLDQFDRAWKAAERFHGITKEDKT
jgi:hypothetical protein